MHLISPLVSGIAGAGDGSARIVRRGTSTRATVYSSFEGDHFPSSSIDADGDVILDAHGRAEVYVDEVCDVTVYDVDGAQQIVFTAGSSASAIEVRSTGFTGTPYDGSAASGTGKPTTLRQVLDLWLTAQGAADWATSAAMQAFIVVTNAPYNAQGDGTTDDTIALQAALATAASTQQLVFFPSGTYRVTSTLTMQPDVVVLGAGATLQMTHASNTLLSVGTGHVLSLYLTTTGTGTLVNSTGRTQLTHCTLEGKGKIITASSMLRLTNCTLTAGAYNDGEEFVELTELVAEVHAEGCTFTGPAGAYTPVSGGMVYGNNMHFDGCVFSASNTATGTFAYVKYNAAAVVGSVRGCTFATPGGATVTAITLGAYGNGTRFFESDNNFQSSVTPYSFTASSTGEDVHLQTREHLARVITDNTGTIAIPTDQYGIIIIKSTHASPVLTGTVPPYGARGTVLFYHPSGGAGTAQPTTNFFGATAATTANTSLHAWEYVCAEANTALRMLVTVDGKALGNGVP